MARDARQGFSLIEMLWVMALMAGLLLPATMVLGRLLGAVRLQGSAWQLWSALGYARAEALYSGRPVEICPLHMRRNQRLLGCRPAWQEGLLLFADRPGAPPGQYDRGEDLRDYSIYAGIGLTAEKPHYRIGADGLPAGGSMPHFLLRETRGGDMRTVTYHTGSMRPRLCPGQPCEPKP